MEIDRRSDTEVKKCGTVSLTFRPGSRRDASLEVSKGDGPLVQLRETLLTRESDTGRVVRSSREEGVRCEQVVRLGNGKGSRRW